MGIDTERYPILPKTHRLGGGAFDIHHRDHTGDDKTIGPGAEDLVVIVVIVTRHRELKMRIRRIEGVEGAVGINHLSTDAVLVPDLLVSASMSVPPARWNTRPRSSSPSSLQVTAFIVFVQRIWRLQRTRWLPLYDHEVFTVSHLHSWRAVLVLFGQPLINLERLVEMGIGGDDLFGHDNTPERGQLAGRGGQLAGLIVPFGCGCGG